MIAAGEASTEVSGPEREFTLITERHLQDKQTAPLWFLPGKGTAHQLMPPLFFICRQIVAKQLACVLISIPSLTLLLAF